ncbi:MAG: DUF427 domain-containing protein [Parvibaculum sp.]|uniref:DUF427 domain-containing protein n=1 Tax=Parvibaculum sp. TaxID=2024848 RepID=UPI0034A035DE
MGQLVSGKEHKSGYESHPEHLLRVLPAGRRVRVHFGGETVADSMEALELFEGSYAPVFYLPRKDVRMDLLKPTESHTWCPFKGEASYWALAAGAEQVHDAVWSYEDPFVEMADIKDYVAFYPNKVDIEADPA